MAAVLPRSPAASPLRLLPEVVAGGTKPDRLADGRGARLKPGRWLGVGAVTGRREGKGSVGRALPLPSNHPQGGSAPCVHRSAHPGG